MSITSLNSYTKRMDKLAADNSGHRHTLWYTGTGQGLDTAQLVKEYCATRPWASAEKDLFIIVPWIGGNGPVPAQ